MYLMRLTELHEEWAWNNYHAQSDERCGEFDKAERRQAKVEALEDEIRARVAAQEIGFRPPEWWRGRLAYGIPDAERVYPAKRRGKSPALESFLRRRLADRKYVGADETFSLDHWTNHARHAVPVEGCHLCREGRR